MSKESPLKRLDESSTYQQNQTARMYNQDELKGIESPQKQMQELQQRLQASEKERISLRKELNKLSEENGRLAQGDESQNRKVEEILRALFEECTSLIEENAILKRK